MKNSARLMCDSQLDNPRGGTGMKQTLPFAADVLIVEDDHILSSHCAGVLTKAGYTSETAENGLQALQHLLQHGYRLLLTDLEMPSLHGWGLIARIRATQSLHDLPIIAMTSKRDRELVAKVVAMGVQGFLLKPFAEEALVEKIDSLLKSDAKALPFATCPGCHANWPDAASFLGDEELLPESFHVVLRKPLDGRIYFYHETCGAKVTVEAKNLVSQVQGAVSREQLQNLIEGYMPVEGVGKKPVVVDILRQLLSWH